MKSDSHNRTQPSYSAIQSLYTKSGLVGFLRQHNLHLSQALGQNFLVNRQAMEAALDAMEWPREGRVIEIGPGLGHLTWLLLERGLSVTAVEMDRTLIPLLGQLAEDAGISPPQLTLLEADAAEVDYDELALSNPAVGVIGNLPYSAAVPIFFRLAYAKVRFAKMGFMVQKEVGERILAPPGGKEYGRLSILLQYIFTVRKVRLLSPGCFFPVPKVESLFLEFRPKPEADLDLASTALERVVQIGFAHRRKKLRGSLRGNTVQRLLMDEAFLNGLESEFDLDQRAEQWPVETWVRFAERVRGTAPHP